MTPPRGSSSHGLVSPVVAVVSSALARRWPHHARPSAGAEGWSVVVGGRGVIEANPSWGVIRWVAPIHGHLHVHVHVVHVWTVAQQTLVDWIRENQGQQQKATTAEVSMLTLATWARTPLVLGLLQGAQQLLDLV